MLTFSCAAKPDGKALTVAPRRVERLRVCAVTAPTPFNRPAHPITLTYGDSRFSALLRALSLPDGQASPGQACPEYAELLPSVIASTAAGALLVHLPVDGCDHSLPAVSAALGAVTAP